MKNQNKTEKNQKKTIKKYSKNRLLGFTDYKNNIFMENKN